MPDLPDDVGPCEVCGEPAFYVLRDLIEKRVPEGSPAEYEVHSTHYFCPDHNRGSRTYRRDDDGELFVYKDEDGVRRDPDGNPLDTGAPAE